MSVWAAIRTEVRVRPQVEAAWLAVKEALGAAGARDLFTSVMGMPEAPPSPGAGATKEPPPGQDDEFHDAIRALDRATTPLRLFPVLLGGALEPQP